MARYRNLIARLGSLSLLLWVGTLSAAAPSDERQQSLNYMLKHDCGSCHGMTLKGGLGPSLLPQVLHGKGHTVDSVSLIIRHGVPEKAMPPWGPLLDDDEIRWLAQRLLEIESSK